MDFYQISQKLQLREFSAHPDFSVASVAAPGFSNAHIGVQG